MIDGNDGPPTFDDSGMALLYDWFKHLVSLSLLTLGGVLGLVQGSDGVPIKRSLLIIVLVLVLTSGVSAFSGAAQVVDSRLRGKPLPTSIQRTLGIVGITLSMAVGAFIYIFVSTLK